MYLLHWEDVVVVSAQGAVMWRLRRGLVPMNMAGPASRDGDAPLAGGRKDTSRLVVRTEVLEDKDGASQEGAAGRKACS